RSGRDWGWGLIVLGGWGNLIDRMRFGFVRDYWPIGSSGIYNNLMDYFIVAGMVSLIIKLWKK
ncbi:MAG: signal peptidase II, partial [Candidatus Shapirobacteria bacterium]